MSVGEKLDTVISELFNQRLREDERVLPAEVVKVNGDGTVDVKIPIDKIAVDTTSGKEQRFKRAVRSRVRCFTLKNGNWSFFIPIHVGDRGVIIAFDRDCRSFFEAKGMDSAPKTFSIFSFDSSFFLPCNFFGAPVTKENSENVLVKYKDKDFVTMDGDNNNITFFGDVIVKGKLDVEKEAEFKEKVEIEGALNAKNNVEVGGEVNVKGVVSAQDIKANGIRFTRHVHPYDKSIKETIPYNTGTAK